MEAHVKALFRRLADIETEQTRAEELRSRVTDLSIELDMLCTRIEELKQQFADALLESAR